jgi:hypothetical protein
LDTTHPIFLLDLNRTAQFAGNELQRCLQRMNGPAAWVSTRDRYEPGEAGLWLGLFPAFGLAAVSCDPLDDEIHIDAHGVNGVIAGSNPRSLLIAAYRYLTELGCRWVRPGPDGEVFPGGMPDEQSVFLHERPSYRHRAVCIEGAVSLENVLDMVDWLPKVGLSGYFMQFREGFTFFDRWYRHKGNPLKEALDFTVDQARFFTRRMESELHKRGLAYHAVGHGWTCESYGVACLGWDREIGRVWPQEFLNAAAEVNGKRSIPWDIPSIAALCYSDPAVQARMVNCVVEYAAAHPQIDLLHVWLDDGFNNKCECERCRQRRPADHYIDILNAIDAGLTARHLAQRVVFLAYVDMLWPPESARIHNPERFVFMFAPISRTYGEVLQSTPDLPPIPPFDLNHLKFPSDTPGLLSFLQGWQELFQGDSFVYDYHFIFAGLYRHDPGLMKLARVISDDVGNLKGLGLNGMVSCQLQRVFFPTGLGMYAMARRLWDGTLDFETLAEDYFYAAFGSEGGLAQAYLLQLAEDIDLGFLWKPEPAAAEMVEAGCLEAFGLLDAFAQVIQRNLDLANASQAQSWKYLELHAQVTRRLGQTLLARVRGQEDAARAAWGEAKTFVRSREDELQPVLDVWGFTQAYDEALGVKAEGG